MLRLKNKEKSQILEAVEVAEVVEAIEDAENAPEEETIETIESLEKEISRLINERKSNHRLLNELIRLSKEKLTLQIANKSK